MENFSFFAVALLCCTLSGAWAQVFLGADAPFGTYFQPRTVSGVVWSGRQPSVASWSDSFRERSSFTTPFGGEQVKVWSPASATPLDSVQAQTVAVSTANDFQTLIPAASTSTDKEARYNKYTIQRHLVNQYDRMLQRFLQTLYVDTVINTLIQPILHRKLINIINIINQETHQPLLYVRKNKPLTAGAAAVESEKLVSVRDEPLVVENEKPVNVVLPPIIIPAVVEKVGYDGNATPLLPKTDVTEIRKKKK